MKLTFNQKLIGLVLVHCSLMVYAMMTNFRWDFLLVAYLLAKLFNMLGHEIGLHRLWSHRSFETTKFKEYVLHLFALPILFGSTVIYTAVHKDHHATADTPRDPHLESLREKLFYIRESNYKIKIKYVTDLLRDPLHKFLHIHYLKLNVLILFLAILIVGPVLTGWFLSFIIVYIWIGGLAINSLGHMPNWGYRNFDTPDNSSNNYILQFMFPGIGLHNNHHAHPNMYNLAITKKEHDMCGWVIKTFFIKK